MAPQGPAGRARCGPLPWAALRSGRQALLEAIQPDRFRQPVGCALAVSPRTERIEPPVILGSALTERGGEKAWELVVARHGEEALAFSNRSLFARLGTEGTALSFAREYREPGWPQRLKGAIEPDVKLYPEREAKLVERAPPEPSRIDGLVLNELAHTYPSLWKGADKPQCRTEVAARARQGSRDHRRSHRADDKSGQHGRHRRPARHCPKPEGRSGCVDHDPAVARGGAVP
jgi:hypothetical protein